MAILMMALIGLLLIIPECRALFEPWMNQAEQTIDANLSLLLAGFVLAMGATVISWLITRWPRREAPEPYRVIRRFRTW